MTRYAPMRRAPRAWMPDTEDGTNTSQPTLDVFEGDREPEFIGLWDANGDPLYRFPETVPFGFHNHGDQS